MFTITITDASAIDAFNRLIAFGESPQPALKSIGEKMLEFTKARFESSTDPYGNPWAPNVDTTLRRALHRGSKNFTKKGGVAWRTKVIYQTNMATSYAAGRFKQLSDPDLLKILPYWQYHHNDSVMHPRPLHVSWDGLTLPPDHPFLDTHFPPNGWGCQCWMSAG